MNADELAKILDELGQRLGPTGEYVFALAVRQAYIEGWTFVGVAVLFGLATLVGVIGSAVSIVRRPSDKDAGYYGAVVAMVSGLGFVIASAFFFAYGLPKLLNPEYAALRDLIGTIR